VNILLSCFSFKEYTGSEIYFYELATAFQAADHDVYLFCPTHGEPLANKVENMFFVDEKTVNNIEYDLVIFSHGCVVWEYIKNVRSKRFINVVHSEVIELEQPVNNSKIDLYVGIRPSIVNFINSYFSFYKIKIPVSNVKLIYNPFDFTRFNALNCNKNKSIKDKVVLFPGTLDRLRYEPIKYLLGLSEKANFKVIHVGTPYYSIVHPNFSTFEATWNLEKYYKQCDIVSGIFLGRTSIEGLLCDKQVFQFDVDHKGNIKKAYWHTEEDLDKFDKFNVVKEFLNEVD